MPNPPTPTKRSWNQANQREPNPTPGYVNQKNPSINASNHTLRSQHRADNRRNTRHEAPRRRSGVSSRRRLGGLCAGGGGRRVALIRGSLGLIGGLGIGGGRLGRDRDGGGGGGESRRVGATPGDNLGVDTGVIALGAVVVAGLDVCGLRAVTGPVVALALRQTGLKRGETRVDNVLGTADTGDSGGSSDAGDRDGEGDEGGGTHFGI